MVSLKDLFMDIDKIESSIFSSSKVRRRPSSTLLPLKQGAQKHPHIQASDELDEESEDEDAAEDDEDDEEEFSDVGLSDLEKDLKHESGSEDDSVAPSLLGDPEADEWGGIDSPSEDAHDSTSRAPAPEQEALSTADKHVAGTVICIIRVVEN